MPTAVPDATTPSESSRRSQVTSEGVAAVREAKTTTISPSPPSAMCTCSELLLVAQLSCGSVKDDDGRR